MANTITPPGGYSPAATALAANQQTLASLGPLPQGQAQAASTAAQQGAQATQTIAQAPQTLQTASTTLSGQAGFPQLNQGYDDLNKQYQLFLHDMQLAGNPPGTTTPPTMGGAPPTNPSQVADPVGQGVQLGQSNPYAGQKYLDQGLDSATQAILGALKSTGTQNIGQFNSTIGNLKDIISSQKDVQSGSEDVLKTIIDAAQTQQSQSLERATAVATLKNAGLSDDAISSLLGVSASTLSAGTADTTTQAQNLLDQVRSGKMSFANADALTASNPALKKSFESLAGTSGIGLGGMNVSAGVAQTAQSLLTNLDTLDLDPGFFGVLKGKDAEALLNTIGQIEGVDPTNKSQMNALAEQFLYSPSDSQTVIANKKAQIKNILGQAAQYVSGGASVSGSSPATGGAKTIMMSPDGKQYTVDNSEVPEATQNGWKAIGSA